MLCLHQCPVRNPLHSALSESRKTHSRASETHARAATTTSKRSPRFQNRRFPSARRPICRVLTPACTQAVLRLPTFALLHLPHRPGRPCCHPGAPSTHRLSLQARTSAFMSPPA
eukprot:XP_001696316.1 predicted protein [Chlamydomonas reinhardtii]